MSTFTVFSKIYANNTQQTFTDNKYCCLNNGAMISVKYLYV